MILVVGATGMLGSLITRRLLVQGRDVRILVRRQSTYLPLVDVGATPVFGDLKDRASLDAACAGVTTVITTANSALRGGADNVQSVDFEGNRNLIDAARVAGVRQFIFVSALGAQTNSPAPFVRAKAQTEEYLRASGLHYTILAPNIFMEVWAARVIGEPLRAGQPVALVGEGRRKHAIVSMHDVAEYAVRTVGNRAAFDRYLMIGGPQALSWRDMIDVYEEVLERDIHVQFVPPGSPVSDLPEVMNALLCRMEECDSPVDMTRSAETFNVRLTPFVEFVRRQHEELAHVGPEWLYA